MRCFDPGYADGCGTYRMQAQGSNEKRKYIATQGPLPRTVDDFWLMIVEQKCNIIVMLAKCYEGGRRKCHKYWPEPKKTSQHGSVSVTNTEEMLFCGFVQRTFHVITELQGEKNDMTVTQFHFLKWPDHGVPSSTSHLLRMHCAIKELLDRNENNSPIVVHCSAGVGRTGTLIGFDILLGESRKQNQVDVFQCVLKMRQQRVEMVQNCDQYMFLHKLLVESYLFNKTDLPSSVFLEKFADKELLKSSAEKQFKDLQTVNSMSLMQELKEGKSDEQKLMITTEGDAIYVELYEASHTVIAAQAPTNDSHVENFWNFVLDRNIGLIVELQNTKDENCIKYWPTSNERSLHIGVVEVSLEEEIDHKYITKRTMIIGRSNQKVTLTQFQYMEWAECNCPLDANQVITLINMMHQTLRESNIGISMIQCRINTSSATVWSSTISNRMKSTLIFDDLRISKLHPFKMSMSFNAAIARQ